MRHILVIGGAGYVGSYLVRRLLECGYQVRVLDQLIYDNAASIADLFEQEGFSFVRGDFYDTGVCTEALHGITDVVLLAALVGDPICKKYPELARKTNLEAPKKLFDALSGKGLNRFIFTSTCSNYGLRADDTPADEASELNPQSLYAESKVAFEKHVLANRTKVDFCPTILRLSTAYGISPRMRFDLTVSEFTRTLALGRKLLVFDENTWRPYCHVADISEAIILTLKSKCETVRGEVFNLGSNAGNLTKKMILDLITSSLGAGDIEYKRGGSDPRNYRVAFEKIGAALGFQARHSVAGNVAALAAAIRHGIFNDYEKRQTFYGNYEILVK